MDASLAHRLPAALRVVAVLLTAGWWTAQPTPVHAADSGGTEFWLAFEENAAPGALALKILGDSGTTGSVAVPGLGFSSPFSIPAGGLSTVAIPAGAMLTAADGVEALGVHVTAGRPVVVYGVNLNVDSADSFLALPLTELGTAYNTVSYTPDPSVGVFESQLAVVGTAAGTLVTVTPTAAIGVHPAGVPYQVSIGAGDVYQAQSPGDLTDTTIVSSLPTAVFSGNPWTFVPSGVGFADQLAEQLLPTSSWGTDVFLVHSALRTADERYRIQVSAPSTTVTLSTGGQVTLSPPGFYESSFSSAVGFQADHPVAVSHFSVGGSSDGGTGDPYLLVELAAERFANGYLVATADDGTTFPYNFVNLVVPAAAVGWVKVDGVRIPAGSFAAIGATGFSECRQTITPGAHRLDGPLPFGASVYGFGPYVSYASPAGGSSSLFIDGFDDGDTLAWSSTAP